MSDIGKLSRLDFVLLASAAAAAGVIPARAATTVNAKLLPSADETWSSLETMVGFGPRYTGSEAHRKYVDFLASGLESVGLRVQRDSYKFPRWEPRSWTLKANLPNGGAEAIPVTFYYPESGQTGPEGVTCPLKYVGKINSDDRNVPTPGDVAGKIVLLDYELLVRHYADWYKPWGAYTAGTVFPSVITSIIGVAAPLLAEFKKAGAAGAILCWTNLSNEQAKNQNLPFGRKLQELPALWVDPNEGKLLRGIAEKGGTVTLTLEADIHPDSPTDTVYAALPGATDKEVMIVNTHTDGPNGIQENGGVGILSLARYLSRLPIGSRNRTIVFALTTGHYASAYVPSIHGFIEQHPEILGRTVASLAIEHLGCREWLDDASMHYRPTGKDDTSFAVTRHEKLGKLVLEAVADTADRRVAVGCPTPQGRYLGEGGTIAAKGIPTVGYFAGPSYLNMEAPDGCLSKLDKNHLHGQIIALTKLIQNIDATSAAELNAGGAQ